MLTLRISPFCSWLLSEEPLKDALASNKSRHLPVLCGCGTGCQGNTQVRPGHKAFTSSADNFLANPRSMFVFISFSTTAAMPLLRSNRPIVLL